MATIIKGTTALCLHLGVAFSVTYAMTGSIAAGGIAAVLEASVNVVASHYHEKVWARIQRRRPQMEMAT
jgi:uncharacterized membrane protein